MDAASLTTVSVSHPDVSAAPAAVRTAGVPAVRASAAKRFVVATAAGYLLSAGALIAFSVYVNCWGTYGSVGYFDMRQYNDRGVKVAYLDSLPPHSRPEILVFGSSNLMGFRAADMTALTGRSSFNCYVTGAHADDYLCLLRHFVQDLQYRPEIIIVGLETWTFRPPEDAHAVIPGVRRCLAGVPQLIRHHPDVSAPRLYWSKLVDCFSRDQLATSWRMLMDPMVKRRAWAPLPQSPVLQPDGSFFYDPAKPYRFAGRVFQLDDKGEFGITNVIREIIDRGDAKELKHYSFFDFDGLWPPHVENFETFLKTCEEEGIRVLLILDPIHPLMAEVLAKSTPQARNHAELLQRVRRWQRDHANIVGVLDATDIASFHGDPDNFYDGTHCGPENARRLLHSVAGLIPRS